MASNNVLSSNAVKGFELYSGFSDRSHFSDIGLLARSGKCACKKEACGGKQSGQSCGECTTTIATRTIACNNRLLNTWYSTYRSSRNWGWRVSVHFHAEHETPFFIGGPKVASIVRIHQASIQSSQYLFWRTIGKESSSKVGCDINIQNVLRAGGSSNLEQQLVFGRSKWQRTRAIELGLV